MSNNLGELSLFDAEEVVVIAKKKRGRKPKKPTLPIVEVNPTHEIVAKEFMNLFEMPMPQENIQNEVLDFPKKKTKGRKKKQTEIVDEEEEIDISYSYNEQEIEREIEELEEDDDSAENAKCIIGLGNLFKETNNFKLLSREQEYDYFVQYQQNPSEELKQFLICSNIKLVISVAKKVSKTTNKIPFEDMIDEGVCGLIKAIDKFNPNLGYKFSTYAFQWIHQAITRFIANNGDMIRVPVHFSDNMNKIRRFENAYMVEHNCDKVPDEITAKELGIELEKIKKYKKATQPCSSLDVSVDDSETPVLDLVEDGFSESPETAVMNNTLHDLLMEAINTLDEREAFIIINRYNLDSNSNPLSLAEIAKKYGLTKERIRQIEAGALMKLRHPSKSSKYRPFYN